MTSKYFYIRRYKKGDFEEIIELWSRIGLGNKERGDNEQTIENTIALGGVFFVLVEKETNKIVGTSWITNDGRRLFLHHFGIDKNYQKRGLSKILLKETLLFTKEKQMQIKLEVHTSNKIAKELYKKHGFKYLGDYDIYIIRDVNTIL